MSGHRASAAAELSPIHMRAYTELAKPYLAETPPDGWHLIDNADADDVRHALEQLLTFLRTERFPEQLRRDARGAR